MKLLVHSQTSSAAPLKFENKSFHPTGYNWCKYLSTIGLKLIHVSKRSLWCEMNIESLHIRCYLAVDLAKRDNTWWRHKMETFSALLALCAGTSPVTGEFPSQRPVRQSFDVFFGLRLNELLSKQSWAWWSETLPCPVSRHCNEYDVLVTYINHWGPVTHRCVIEMGRCWSGKPR